MKVKVPVYGTVGRAVLIDASASAGATIGKDLKLPTGTVATLADLQQLFGSSAYHGNLSGLQSGNDHPQYPLKAGNETIAGSWNFVGVPSIGGVLLPEYIEDTIGATLTNTSSVTLSYGDTAGHISAAIVDEYVEDLIGGMLTNTSSITLSYGDTAGQISASVVDEYAQDLVGAMLTTTSSVALSYNDGAGTIGAAIVDEYVEDLMATVLSSSATIEFNHYDTAGHISAHLTAVLDDLMDVDSPGVPTTGYVLTWNGGRWVPAASAGGGGGSVDSVVAGTGISVDSSDAANPIVSVDQTFSPTWSGNHAFSNPILAPAGSNAAPSYTFSGDTNTGLYSVGADSLGIATGGALHTTFKAAGAVETYVTGGTSIYSLVGGGDSGQGQAVVVGATQHTDSAALSYRAYLAYDCYWDDAADAWTAVRTTLGNKWMLDMGYHNNAFRVRSFNGTVSSPWADSAWANLLTVTVSGSAAAQLSTFGDANATTWTRVFIGSGTATGGSVGLYLNGATGVNRQLIWETAGSLRWNFECTSTAESGSNAGSNFALKCYDDAAAALFTVFSVVRSTGFLTFPQAVYHAAGTASIPTISFSGDTNSGFYSIGADNIGIALGGTKYVDLGTGTFAFGSGSGGVTFIFDGGAGQTRDFIYRSGGSNRWIFRVDSSTESGSDAGSNFSIRPRSDAGADLGAALSITRATGAVSIGLGTLTLSYQLLAAPGSASAPGMAFFNDTNTGVFSVAADSIGIATGGTERVRIDSSGAWGLAGANYGTSGQVLKSNGAGAAVTWATVTGVSPLTTKGDIHVYSTTDARLPVGTNGQILSADSTQTTGLKWIASPASPLTTKGDLYTYASADARLAVGSDGQVLIADSAAATGMAWVNSCATRKTLSAEILADSPTVFWKCDEASGTLTDYGSAGVALTSTGSVTYQKSSLIPSLVNESTQTRHAYMAAGSNGFQATSGLGLSYPLTGDWTWEGVFSIPVFATSASTLFFIGGSGETEAANIQAEISVSTAGLPGSLWESSAGTNQATATTFNLVEGKVYHMVVVKDGTANTLDWYLNGVWAGQTSYSTEPTGGSGTLIVGFGVDCTPTNTGALIMGYNAFYNGSKLSQTRIEQHAQAAGLFGV